MIMHRLIPTGDGDETYYQVTAKGRGAKPMSWSGYVLASGPEEARQIIRRGNAEDLQLGLMGVQKVTLDHVVDAVEVEAALVDIFRPNAVVYETDERAYRVHSGMLKADDKGKLRTR